MQRPQGLGTWTPAPAYLPKTPGWAGCQQGSPFNDGFLPLAFLTLTLVPVWDGESLPHRGHCRPWLPSQRACQGAVWHRQVRPPGAPCPGFYIL